MISKTEVAEAMGRGRPVYPDYSIIGDTLSHMGISARAETFKAETEETYPDLHSALLSMARGSEINQQQHAKLLEIARKRFIRTDHHYTCSRTIKWVLISWKNKINHKEETPLYYLGSPSL
jgi:hypothetical protein